MFYTWASIFVGFIAWVIIFRKAPTTRCAKCYDILSAIRARERTGRRIRMADFGRLSVNRYYSMCLFFGRICQDMKGLPDRAHQEARSQGQETNLRLLVHLDIEGGETEKGDVGSLQVIYSNPEFQKKNKPSHIYLVDCYDACVVRKGFNSSKPTYAALSYVWGTVSQFKLLKENHDSLHKPGSLGHRRWPLNRSIQDAMDLCRELGNRYLWVDTLCTVQDDVPSKKLCLNNMDCTYHLACLTIVSAADDDATAGLPAYKFERASLNRSFSARGLHLYEWKNSWSELDLCLPTWHARGWTYQEMVLSTRMLVFTADTVFCMTPGNIFFYDPMSARLLSKSCMDLTLSPSNHSLKPSQVTASSAMGTFGGALEVYASRQLSQDSDNINAFQGILQVLEPVLGPTWHGLFLANFASYLHHSSWVTIPVRVPQFPSWSWAGWKLNRTGINISRVASSALVFRAAYNGRPGPIDTYTTEQKDFMRQMGRPYPRDSSHEFHRMTLSRAPNLIGFWAWEVKLWVSPPGERNIHAVSVTQDDRPYLAEYHHSVWQIRLEQRWAEKTMTPGRSSFIVFAVTQPYKLVHPMMVDWVDGIAYRANFVSPRSFVSME